MTPHEASIPARGEPGSAQKIHARGGKHSEDLARWAGCAPESLKGPWALVSFAEITRSHQRINTEYQNARFLRNVALAPIGVSIGAGLAGYFFKVAHPGMTELLHLNMFAQASALVITQLLLGHANKSGARMDEEVNRFRTKIPPHYWM